MSQISVLIIDDDANIRKLLTELLSGRPEYRVLVAGEGKEAVRCFVEEKVDVVLTDIHMPGFTGLELMADMQKVKFKPEILVMTANATPENVETARKIGARSVILKPFDNLDIVESEIAKAAQFVRENPGRRAAGRDPAPSPRPPAARGPQGAGRGTSQAAPPAAPRPPAAAPRRPAQPPAAPVPVSTPSDDLPEVDAWKSDLVDNSTPAPASPAPRAPAPPPPAVKPAARPAAPAARPAPAARAAAPRAPAPPPVVEEEPIALGAEEPAPEAEPAAARLPEIPPELMEIFQMVGSLDVGKMQMQVPIICLQTWEEKAAVAALQEMARSLQREFYTWSAARGIVKESGQSMGEIYRDPGRTLEFIRRQKGNGIYVLADFRQCLEDRMVVRVLREMVMEMETGRALLVLTAPRLAIPPELSAACVSFEWPAGGEADLGALFEEVVAEISASSGRPVRIDRASREALLQRVKEMPAGRARFEIARALMAVGKRAS